METKHLGGDPVNQKSKKEDMTVTINGIV